MHGQTLSPLKTGLWRADETLGKDKKGGLLL